MLHQVVCCYLTSTDLPQDTNFEHCEWKRRLSVHRPKRSPSSVCVCVCVSVVCTCWTWKLQTWQTVSPHVTARVRMRPFSACLPPSLSPFATAYLVNPKKVGTFLSRQTDINSSQDVTQNTKTHHASIPKLETDPGRVQCRKPEADCSSVGVFLPSRLNGHEIDMMFNGYKDYLSAERLWIL